MDGAGSQEVCSDLSAFKAQRAFGIAVLGTERLPMKRHPHRGIIVAGHPTSLRLEAEFWDFLREIAYERQLSLSELINAISQAKSRKVTLVRVDGALRKQKPRTSGALTGATEGLGLRAARCH